MAIALAADAEVKAGEVVTWSVSGATLSGNVDVHVYSEDPGSLELNAVVAADGSGDYDPAGVLDIRPNKEGHLHIEVTDETGSTTDSASVQVFKSA